MYNAQSNPISKDCKYFSSKDLEFTSYKHTVQTLSD